MQLGINLCFLISLLVVAIAYLYNRILYNANSANVLSLGTIDVAIFEFDNFHNDLLGTVSNFCQVFAHTHVFSESFIYPPVKFSQIAHCQINVVERRKSPYLSFSDLNSELLITSPYLLVIPDFTRIFNHSLLNFQLSVFSKLLHQSSNDALILPIYSGNEDVNVTCKPFYFDTKKWTFSYVSNSNFCEYHWQPGFVVLMKTRSFFKMHQPFSLPFTKSLFVQSQLANLTIKYLNEKLFTQVNNLYSSERLQAKHFLVERHRINQLYRDLGIKKVQHLDRSVEWFGCERQSARCFDTIIDDTPQYLVQNRWLPPCCKRNLEMTGRYVIELLHKSGVRYWLEGGSLLGAARNGAIIEWDYDIDIGIYRADSDKLPILSRLLQSKPGSQLEDGQGFLWQRALEGDFVKVHFSQYNTIHVDIFPFDAINGTMTKDTWFADHPQDMPFEEHFLKPFTKIEFIGIMANAPNNVRDFLEMKFGTGAIENPKYPRELEDSD